MLIQSCMGYTNFIKRMKSGKKLKTKNYEEILLKSSYFSI